MTKSQEWNLTSNFFALDTFIRVIPNFPKPGIMFRDITPLLHNPPALRTTNDRLAEIAESWNATLVAGIGARGFLFGLPVAERLSLPFVPVRKPGKLPAEHASVNYELEYGSDSVELHCDPPVAEHRVVIVDDLLATGGTAAATTRLIRNLGGFVVGCVFVIELLDLGGRDKLAELPVEALLEY